MKTPILGSSYVARSVNAADARMVNLFPEIIPEGGKEAAFLSRTPGLNYFTTIGGGPVRGMWVIGTYLYVVSQASLFQMDTLGNLILLGSVANDGLPVSMSDNGTQLFVACNGPSYIYNVQTMVFQQISDVNFPGALTVAFLDGFFVVNHPNTRLVYVSAINDGTSWDSLAVSKSLWLTSNIVGLIVLNSQLWVFGDDALSVWYNAGNQPFPFLPVPSAINENGCASPYCIAKLDNSVFWLSSDTRGHGIVYRSQGYSGVRVSTHAVEWQIQQYGDLSQAIAYTYQQDGHAFYVLAFPGQNTTWVYDVVTEAWHERCGFVNGSFTRHSSNCQAFFNNQIFVGDYISGNVYTFDLTNYDDKWLRSWRALPSGQNDLTRAAHHSLQLDCETGVGLNTGQGSDPQVMLRWSDDGGHTWSNEHWVSIGAIGTFGQRAIWRRLGMTMKLRDRVYEVSGSDPVKIAILGAELHASNTNA